MILGAVVGSSAHAVEGLSVTGSFDFESEYVFRGKRFTQAAFQPSVEAGYAIGPGEAYAGVWTNLPINSNNVGGVSQTQGKEIDLFLGYALPVSDMLTVDTGFTYYWYPDAAGTGGVGRSREVYVGLQGDVLLDPAVYVYYDFDLSQVVVEGSIGYSLPLSDYVGLPLSLDTIAYVGYLHAEAYNGNQRNPGENRWKNGFVYAGAASDLVYSISENLTFSIGVRLAGNNDGTAGGPNGGSPQLGGETKLWWGSSLVFAF